MRTFFCLLLISLVATSCSTVKSGSTKTLDIVGPGVIQMPLVADLKVRPNKVSHTKTFVNISNNVNAKSDVVRELLQRENADVLVEPTFESTTTAGRTELKVYGFPATYVNFRTIEEKDVRLIEVTPGLLQKAETHESSVLTTQK